MNKYLNIFLLLIMSVSLFAQQNHVGNYDFEYQGPNFNCAPYQSIDNQNTMEEDWTRYAPWTIPEKAHWWNTSVGSPDFVCDGNGGHYTRCFNEEFVCQGLPIALQQGHSYYIQYDAYLENSNQTFFAAQSPGLKLHTERPKQRKRWELTKGFGSSTLPIPDGEPFFTWFQVSGTTPSIDEAYTWISYGHHKWKKGQPSGGFIFVDNVKIVDVGTSDCPEYNKLQNIGFDHIGKLTYKSQYLTIAGYNVDNTVPQGLVIAGTEAKLRLQSAELVSLMDGFGTQNGAEFEAVIAPCRNDCPLPIAPTVGEINACSVFGTTYPIGSSSIFGQTYSWSVADPTSLTASGLPYNYNFLNSLSSTTTANPTFTQPHGYGIITYKLTVTNACGQTSEGFVTINIDENSNPNPQPLTFVYSNYQGNYNSDTHQIGFYYDGMTNNTEMVLIQVYDNAGNLWEEIEQTNVNGFGSTGGAFLSSAIYSPCTVYHVYVSQKNHCSENLSTPLHVIVNPNTPPYVDLTEVPNFFSPNDDHVNEYFSVNALNAAAYSVWVYDAGGVLVYEMENAAITGLYPNIWDGSCNRTCAIINPHNVLCDGTYYYVLYLYGCNHSNVTDFAGYVEIRDVDCDNRPGNPNGRVSNPALADKSENVDPNLAQTYSSKLFVYPNPNNGSFKIGLPVGDADLTVEILSSVGAVVKTIQWKKNSESPLFNIENLAQGLYTVVVKQNDSVIGSTRVVVNQ